jgi:hypothetical protein
MTAPDFTPPDFTHPISGPAYGPAFRLLATAMMIGVMAMAARATLQLPDDVPAAQGYWMLGLGLLALIASYWILMRARTTIDATGIRQTGLTDTVITWPELYSARLFGPPFARRLMVRTIGGRFRFIFGGSPELLAAFARIAEAYRK